MLNKFNDLYTKLIHEWSNPVKENTFGKINVGISLKCIKWASDKVFFEPVVMSTGEPYINNKAGWKDMMKGHGFQQSGWLTDAEEAAKWLYNGIKEIQESAATGEWPSTGKFRMLSAGLIGQTGLYRKFNDKPLPNATAAEGNKYSRWMTITVIINSDNFNNSLQEWFNAWSKKARELDLD